MYNLKWVFGNSTLPRTMATVWEVRWEAWAEVGETRAERVGGLKRGIRKVNGSIWDGGERVCGAAIGNGGGVEREREGSGGGVVVDDRESVVVDGYSSRERRRRTLDLKRRVAAAGGVGERERWRSGGEGGTGRRTTTGMTGDGGENEDEMCY